MACDTIFWSLVVFGCSIQLLFAAPEDEPIEYMSKEEREALKEEARDMFYHAYNAYMDNAYPADELMPLSCKGRYRGSEPNRGDIDSTLGNFSLTLVDTLDTLVVLGDLEEFENAVKLVARDVNFDTDVIVSLFETNIRMLGGLLSGHILAEYLQQRADIMPWYRGELLNLAKDLGYRFLPAFNTTTGIPYGRINLKFGMKGVPVEVSRETCTACAGSMILEMAALSRLTGERVFEEKAQKAMDVLWRMRHRGTDLMGSVLNVNSGDWVRRDSGVGAGIDSYYEYCLKAYILLGDEKYLGRFNKHYQAVMKYVSQGPMLLDVHMHKPNTNSKNFMDALLAFWPGLQVLKGDIKPAVETHEMLYQVMQRHNFIPEAFTTDFQVHWGHHPLRPEFLESTYFLYRATSDHYYLGVGRKVLKSLQTYARVPCGYAAVSDVRTNKHDDTMDSFVLSETFKYLFLLFAEPGELILDLDEFIFTTEGHLLPLTLASVRTNISSDFERDVVHVDELDRTCPNSLHLFPASVRQPLRNMVEDVCPRRTIRRRLSAAQFEANNLEHLKLLSDMGITTLTLADGLVQLLHTFSNAKTPQDSEEGLLFMQEMVEINKMQAQQVEAEPRTVSFIKPKTNPPEKITLLAGPAHFGLDLQKLNKLTAKIDFVYPPNGCTDIVNANQLTGKIAVMKRGNCMFTEKARRIQKAGAVAGIVIDNVVGSSAASSSMFAMSGEGKKADDVMIPVVFLFSTEGSELIKAYTESNNELSVTLGNFFSKEEVQLKAPTDLSMFERLKGSLKSFLTQQTTPQTSSSIWSNADVTVSDVKNQEDEKEVVQYYDLYAEIVKDALGGEVKITSAYVFSNLVEQTEETTPVEKRWRQLKELFAHEVYWEPKRKNIRTYILESYYNWVMKARGADEETLNVPLRNKVLWFLKELTHVFPNPSIVKTSQLMEGNQHRLVREYVLSRMDAMVLIQKEMVNILKDLMKMAQSMQWLRNKYMLRMSAINVGLNTLPQYLTQIPVTDNEDYQDHLTTLLRVKEEIVEECDKIFGSVKQSSLNKSPNPVEKDPFFDMARDHIQFSIFNALTRASDDAPTIANIMADVSGIGKLDIKNKDSVPLPARNEEKVSEKLEEYQSFLWSEIQKLQQSSEENIFGNYPETGDSIRNEADIDSKETTDSSNVFVDISPQNQSNRKKIIDKLMYKFANNNLEDLRKNIEFFTNLYKDTDTLVSAQPKNSESQNVNTGENEKEEFALDNDDSSRDTNIIIDIADTKEIDRETKEIDSVIDSTKILNPQISKEESKEAKETESVNKNILSPSELTEFTESICNETEEKQERSAGVRGDMGIPEASDKSTENGDFGTQRKHIAKIENDEIEKNSHKSRHIGDEL